MIRPLNLSIKFGLEYATKGYTFTIYRQIHSTYITECDWINSSCHTGSENKLDQ